MLSTWTWLLLGSSALLSVIYFIGSKFGRRRRPGEPAVVAGSLIWGSAVDFAGHAVNFLHQTRKRYGEVFTLRLINQHLTIVMDPHSYEVVSKERNFDFDPIQKQVNRNVFNYALVDAKTMLTETSKTVRGEPLIGALDSFINNLTTSCDRISEDAKSVASDEDEKPWSSSGLRQFTAKTLFDAIFSTVFGRDDNHVFSSQLAFTNFEIFHKYFNYLWLGMPSYLFPKALSALDELVRCPDAAELLARPDLSHYMRRAIEFMQQHNQTETDIKGHNLVFLHVNYNTFRLAFWALSNLLEDPLALKAVTEEIEQVLANKYDEETKASWLDMKDIENMPILDSLVQETTRLSSGVFMVRYVTADTKLTVDNGNEYLIRKGDRIAMYPPAIHKDPEIFEDPLVFKHDRFVDAKFYKAGKEIKHPVMGFGTLCPGKRYALLQLKWYLMTIITRFEARLQPGQHAEYDSNYHGHEVLPPTAEVNIDYRPKSSYPVFKFRTQRPKHRSAEMEDRVSMAA